MPTESPAEADVLARALGRLPSGLFILTVGVGDDATAMLVSWVQQAGFRPPMLTVALRSDSAMRERVERSGRFVLNQVPEGHKGLLKHFARGFAPGVPAFDGVALRDEGGDAGPVLAEALGYLVAEVRDGLESGDHRIVLAEVVAGAMLVEGVEPMIHVRRHGLHY